MSCGRAALKVDFVPCISNMVLLSFCIFILIPRSVNHTDHDDISVAWCTFAKLCCMTGIGIPVASPESALFLGSCSLAKLLEHFLG